MKIYGRDSRIWKLNAGSPEEPIGIGWAVVFALALGVLAYVVAVTVNLTTWYPV